MRPIGRTVRRGSSSSRVTRSGARPAANRTVPCAAERVLDIASDDALYQFKQKSFARGQRMRRRHGGMKMKILHGFVSCGALCAAMLASPVAAQTQPAQSPVQNPSTGEAPQPAVADEPQQTRQAPGETPPTVATAQTSEPGEVDDGIGEIIVTALRRETSLQRTPQAISVVNGPALQLSGRSGLDDLKLAVPNVNFAATSNVTQLYIRGIGNTFINAGGDPGVALYQDNAYISDQTTANVSFFDIERVEVLRGPQGALYGRNATGGAISVISARPTSTEQGQVAITVGNFGRVDAEGYISGPLGIADTSARLSFQSRHLSGYIRNDYRADPRAPDRLDDLDSQAVRLQTLTTLPGEGTLSLLASHYRERDNGPALAVVPTPGFIYPAEALNGAIPSARARNITVDEGAYRSRVTILNANLDQPLADGTLTLTGNYRRSSQFFDNDCDGTPVNNCSYIRETDSDDYYADAHYASGGVGGFRWLVGATYLNFAQRQGNTVLWEAPSTYIGGPSASIPVPLDTLAGGRVKTESYAFYADLRLQLTDVFAATGQVRYNETRKRAREYLIIPTFMINVTDSPVGLKDSSVPFKVGVEGQFTPVILGYANYSTAFKDGAINLGALQVTPIREEQAKTFEAGIKSSFFNRRLQVNAAAFHSTYDNLQISQLIGTILALVNAPRSEITGFELEVVAAPVRGLKINGSLGYLDPTLKEFSNARTFPGANGPLLDLAGNQLPYVAKWNATLGATYDFEPVQNYTATLGAGFTYQSRTFFNEFNDASNSQAPVGRLDLSASVGPSDENWKLFGYVRNVTNELVLTGTTIYSPLLGAEKSVAYAPPRNFGIGFRYSF
ncbi:MAG: TonB-dependent receptor [Hyphomicrobium sp.]|nr:TonB-dependent receptor [Hyphomicrobium sp.]